MKYKLIKTGAVVANLMLVAATCSAIGNNVGGSAGISSLHPSNNNVNPEFAKNNYEVPINLSDAFDDRTGMDKGHSCLVNASDPRAVVLSNPKLSIDFTNTVTAQYIGALFNTGINGNADFGLFSTSLTAEYTRSLIDTQRSINFNYVQTLSADATFTVKGTGNSILNQDAQNILAESTGEFTQICGNSIVQSSKKGAVLEASVTINFANAAQKRQFEKETAGSISGIESIVSAFENSEHSSTQGATIGISVYQSGGDPTKLNKIYDGLICLATDLAACKQIINNLINYTNSDFQTGVNFRDPTTLYTYKPNSKQYVDLGVKASLQPLTPDEQTAKNYLSTTITQDRQMLDYLNAYQKQGFFAQYVDSITQANIRQAAKDYSTMLDNYNNFDIIDSCYSDTSNINTRCILAASQIKNMHSTYQASIALANNLAIVMDMNSPIGEIIFIPIDRVDSSVGGTLNNATGLFAAYLPKIQAISSKCYIDSSTDYEYFRTYFPQYGSKSIYCVDDPTSIVPGVTNFLVEGFGNRNFQGIAARMVNGVEVKYPVGPSGYNVQYLYSDSSDFKYNPI